MNPPVLPPSDVAVGNENADTEGVQSDEVFTSS